MALSQNPTIKCDECGTVYSCYPTATIGNIRLKAGRVGWETRLVRQGRDKQALEDLCPRCTETPRETVPVMLDWRAQ